MVTNKHHYGFYRRVDLGRDIPRRITRDTPDIDEKLLHNGYPEAEMLAIIRNWNHHYNLAGFEYRLEGFTYRQCGSTF